MKAFRKQFPYKSCLALALLLLALILAACGRDQEQPAKKTSSATTANSPAGNPDDPVSEQVAALLKSSFILDDVLFVLNSYKTREAAAEYFIPHVGVYPFNESYTDGDILMDEFLAQDKPPVYSIRLRYNKDSEEINGALVALIPEQGEKGKELAALAVTKTETPSTKEEIQKSFTDGLGTLALNDGRTLKLSLLEDIFADKTIYTVIFDITGQAASAVEEKK